MRRYLITAFVLTGLGIAGTTPALGQAYESAAGWSGGVLIATSLNEGAEGADPVELKPDATWLVSVHYDRWFGKGNVGVRARGSFTKPKLPWVQGQREIRVYMADLGVLLRPIAPAEGNTFLPFVSGGIGFIHWGLGDGPPTTFDPAGASYRGQDALDLVAAAGLGMDFVTPWTWDEGPVVVRLEARDHLQFSSPFDPASSDASEFGLIHNAAVVLGFHTGIGILGGR
jgi:hypothetical protein